MINLKEVANFFVCISVVRLLLVMTKFRTQKCQDSMLLV